MLVSKICLTGGPCGGKSTALSTIERNLTDMGYKVFIIEETATRTIETGVKPFGDNAIPVYDFEDIIMEFQKSEEELYEIKAKESPEKCIILCDRGIFDINSFISNSEFESLLKKYNLPKLKTLDSYDLVIHLNSVVKGAEQYYTLENNKARSEGIKDAKIRDDACQQAWCMHNNYHIVDNSTDFKNKIDRVVKIINEHLGIKHLQTKKYLIDKNAQLEEFLNINKLNTVIIEQIYLENDDESELRLRKRSINNENSYYLTKKKSFNKDSYIEEEIITEQKISESMFHDLINNNKIIGRITKERTNIVYCDNYYKIDKFETGEVILETNTYTKIPPIIDVIEDVTNREDFKNINMSKNKVYVK